MHRQIHCNTIWMDRIILSVPKFRRRTLDVTVVYTGSREEVLKTLENFTYQGTEVPENYLANSGREMNREYKDQLINKVVMHYGIRLFLPMDIRSVITTVKSFKYLWHWDQDPGKGEDRSTGTGCHRYWRIRAAR